MSSMERQKNDELCYHSTFKRKATERVFEQENHVVKTVNSSFRLTSSQSKLTYQPMFSQATLTGHAWCSGKSVSLGAEGGPLEREASFLDGPTFRPVWPAKPSSYILALSHHFWNHFCHIFIPLNFYQSSSRLRVQKQVKRCFLLRALKKFKTILSAINSFSIPLLLNLLQLVTLPFRIQCVTTLQLEAHDNI